MHILRVDMSDQSISMQKSNDEFAYHGGRNLIAKIMHDEVDPRCDPLGAQNKLILAPGLLANTSAPCSARLSIGGKSPLTNTIKEANAGGTAALAIAKLGLKAIIIEGKPVNHQWYFLKIAEDKVDVLPADEYMGMNNYALSSKIREVFGDKYSVVSIGGAGEKGYRNSTIQVTDQEGRPSRAAARGGLGSVMASKKIKAIVIDTSGTYKADLHDKEEFSQAAKSYVKGILDNPISGQAMPQLGTAVLVNMVNAIGALPTKNFSQGSHDEAEKISGEQLAEIQKTRNGKLNHKCQPGCVIGCSNIYNDENGEYLTSGFEYETIALNGANCGIFNLDTIAKIDKICDDFGLDTMETGCTIAVCMEAKKIPFGDEEGVFMLIKEMIDSTEFGKILGMGTDITGRYFGVKRIPTVKGQSIAAYDPRSLKGTGVTYATSTMGADHTTGATVGNPTVDPYKKEGQVELSSTLQRAMATFDTLGMCIFASFCISEKENVDYLVKMLSAKYGTEWDVEKFFGLGVQTISLEKTFNYAAGFSPNDDVLPDFFYREELPPHNTVFDIAKEEMAEVNNFI